MLEGKQTELSHSSLIRLRAVLGQAIRWGEKRGYVHRNVAALADMPSASSQERTGRAMRVDEAHRPLDAIATARPDPDDPRGRGSPTGSRRSG